MGGSLCSVQHSKKLERRDFLSKCSNICNLFSPSSAALCCAAVLLQLGVITKMNRWCCLSLHCLTLHHTGKNGRFSNSCSEYKTIDVVGPRPNKGERKERRQVTLINLPLLEMLGAHSRTREPRKLHSPTWRIDQSLSTAKLCPQLARWKVLILNCDWWYFMLFQHKNKEMHLAVVIMIGQLQLLHTTC